MHFLCVRSISLCGVCGGKVLCEICFFFTFMFFLVSSLIEVVFIVTAEIENPHKTHLCTVYTTYVSRIRYGTVRNVCEILFFLFSGCHPSFLSLLFILIFHIKFCYANFRTQISATFYFLSSGQNTRLAFFCQWAELKM